MPFQLGHPVALAAFEALDRKSCVAQFDLFDLYLKNIRPLYLSVLITSDLQHLIP